MSTLTDELQRKLRAVLSLRVQAPISSDVPVVIRAREGRYDDALGMQRPEIEIVTTAHPYAAWSYEEPGAWEMLLADLEAIPDEPTAPPDTKAQLGQIVSKGRKDGISVMAPTPPLVFVRVERISEPRRARKWWAWDELGAKYYLHFVFGQGSVHPVIGGEIAEKPIREFTQGTSNFITLEAFASYVGIDVSQIPEADRS